MLLLASGLKPSRIARESLFVAVFAAATFGLKKIGAAVPDTGAIARESGVFGLKLLAAFFLGRLFYASTRISEIRDAITRIMRLIPFARRYDLGLALALILSYVPLIGREWSESSQAMQARGMSNFANPRNVSCFISSMLRRLMIEAVDLPLALYARGWHRDRALSKLTWKKLDSFALSLSFILLFMTALRLV
jgi:energy-coupling factor transporter transmembrane protein EcfT